MSQHSTVKQTQSTQEPDCNITPHPHQFSSRFESLTIQVTCISSPRRDLHSHTQTRLVHFRPRSHSRTRLSTTHLSPDRTPHRSPRDLSDPSVKDRHTLAFIVFECDSRVALVFPPSVVVVVLLCVDRHARLRRACCKACTKKKKGCTNVYPLQPD